MSLDDEIVPMDDDLKDGDLKKVDEVQLEELLEPEVVDVVDLLADEPKDPMEMQDEDDEYREVEMLMDPYGLNDF